MNVSQLTAQLKSYESTNYRLDGYYDGEMVVPNLGIAVPPILGNKIKTVIGWPSTIIDVLEERLDWLGWDDDGKFGLEDLYDENQLDYESSLVHIDSLLYGVGFAAVHTGFQGEPGALVTAETPKHTTGIWDRRTRRLSEGLTRHYIGDQCLAMVHYELMRTTYYKRDSEQDRWKVDKVDNHRMNRVPLVRFINRGRAGRRDGKSEITKAIRSYTDVAVRTLLGMEVNREFFSAPQRYALGVKEDAFVDEAGNPIPGWKAIMGSLWRLYRDEEGAEASEGKWDGIPKVGQFPQGQSGPYLEQLRGISQLVSAEAGIPPSYLGFATDNPPSADSIRALENRLVKRAERRQSAYDPSWGEVGILTTMIAGPKTATRQDIPSIWRDASTPTKSADADRATKLVGAGILLPDSDVTYEMVGLTPRQVKVLRREQKTAEGKALAQALIQGVTNVSTGGDTQQTNTGGNNTPVGQQQRQ